MRFGRSGANRCWLTQISLSLNRYSEFLYLKIIEANRSEAKRSEVTRSHPKLPRTNDSIKPKRSEANRSEEYRSEPKRTEAVLNYIIVFRKRNIIDKRDQTLTPDRATSPKKRTFRQLPGTLNYGVRALL